MKKIINITCIIFLLFFVHLPNTQAQVPQIDNPVADITKDTTGITNFCYDGGFETGNEILWNNWHAAYGTISSNSNSVNILNPNYAFTWGIKSVGSAGAEFHTHTLPCSRYIACNQDDVLPNNLLGAASNLSEYLQKNQIHHNIASSGFDPIVSTLNKTHSGNYSLRLGNAASNNGFEFIEKKMLVTSANSIFSFWYASVMSNPEHGAGQDQYFGVNVFGISGTTLNNITNTAGGISVNVGSGTNTCYSSDAFSTAFARNKFCDPLTAMPGGIKYRNWNYVSLNLSSQIGNTVVIRLWTRDCSHCGDFAYVYLDDFCSAPDQSNPTGSILLEQHDTCAQGKICISYTLPQTPTASGSVQIQLPIYQNGILVTTLNSPLLFTGSSYCFPITASLLATLTANAHFDYSVVGNFNLGGTSLASQYIGFTGSGQDLINNNDYAIVCPIIQNPCTCGQWGSIGYSLANIPGKFSCNGSTKIIDANLGDLFSLFPSYNCLGSTVALSCNPIFTYDVYFPKGGILLDVKNIKDQKLDSCGEIRVVMRVKCGDQICEPCEFIVRVNCCKCAPILKPTLYWTTGSGSSIIDNQFDLKCGETYTNKLKCFETYTIKVQNPCGDNCAADEIITTIMQPNGILILGNMVTANQVGTYTVTIKVKCNGKWCEPCVIKFVQTQKCEPPCNNCKDKVSFEFDSGLSSIDVKTNPLASTLSATFVLGGGSDTYTQLRANVIDFQITSDNPACLQCYNTPNQWGSIVGGSISGFSTLITTYPSVAASNVNNSSREIVFNAASPVAISMGTNLNLTIKVPGVNPISCCCIKVVLYIKITYRNNKCEECTQIVRVGFKECPNANGDNGLPTGNGTGTFDPDGGQPQFRMHSPNNDEVYPTKTITPLAPKNK